MMPLGSRRSSLSKFVSIPYLTWRWKATRLPKGGDIRKRETDDQAGQIYVLFPKFPAMVNTRSMGYIWDAVTPVGTSGTSTAYSKMKYVVLQSGAEKLDQWIWETRNVYEDYKKYFQEDPPQAGAVLLYINTQHTQSFGGDLLRRHLLLRPAPQGSEIAGTPLPGLLTPVQMAPTEDKGEGGLPVSAPAAQKSRGKRGHIRYNIFWPCGGHRFGSGR